MTVKEYAEKYHVPASTVYNHISDSSLPACKINNQWDVADVPPHIRNAKWSAVKIEQLSDYDISLIWLNGTIMDDSVIIRSKSGFVPKYIADRLGKNTINTAADKTIVKISSIELVSALRKMGFTGRMDADLQPPMVDELPFAAALFESRVSKRWTLRYHRRHPKDKDFAKYVPAISLCASYPIIQRAIDILSSRGVMPLRKIQPASNGTSGRLEITSYTQLENICSLLRPFGANERFWCDYKNHISQAHIPYYDYHLSDGEK